MNRFMPALLIVALFLFPICSRVDAVVINEFLPNPSGDSSEDSEWIELYNPDSDVADISGWKLDDADGGSNPYILASGSAIVPGGFLVFEKSITNIALNNSGDSVRLVDASDQTKDSYTYTQTNEDRTIGRSSNGGGSWVVCVSQTKGTSNNCPQPTVTPMNTPVSTVVPTATFAPTQAPTSTPLVTSIPTPTKTPTPNIPFTPTIDPSLDILGIGSASAEVAGVATLDRAASDIIDATSSPSPSPSASRMRPLIISLLMIAMGLALLTGVLIWQKKDIWKSNIQK